MYNISDLRVFRDVAHVAGIDVSNIKSFTTYVDQHFFFDYVARVGDAYVNVCEVNECNRARYLQLIEINNSNVRNFISSPIADIIHHEERQWFVEMVPMRFSNMIATGLLKKQLLELWDNVDQLNDDVNSIGVDPQIVQDTNALFRQMPYYDEVRRLYAGPIFDQHNRSLNVMYANFVDFEKAFELGRIGYDKGYKFSGLQSFVACPSLHGRATSMLFSIINDNDTQIIEKLNCLNNSAVGSIIDIIFRQMNDRPNYYTYDVTNIRKQLERVKELL